MINRLGDLAYWIGIGLAIFVAFFMSSQAIFDDLFRIERGPYAAESEVTQVLFSALLFAFYFAIGWAMRFLLTGRFDLRVLPNRENPPSTTLIEFAIGIFCRLVFLVNWGSLRLGILLAACSLLYGYLAWGSPDAEFVKLPLLASGLLLFVWLVTVLFNYVLTGKGKIER